MRQSRLQAVLVPVNPARVQQVVMDFPFAAAKIAHNKMEIVLFLVLYAGLKENGSSWIRT